MGHSTCRPKYVHIVNSSTKYFVARMNGEGKPFLRFDGKTEHSYIVDSSIQISNNIMRRCYNVIITKMFTQTPTILRNISIAYLVNIKPQFFRTGLYFRIWLQQTCYVGRTAVIVQSVTLALRPPTHVQFYLQF